MSECLVNGCTDEHAAWLGVVSLALGVFGFITAELLPASLLIASSGFVGLNKIYVAYFECLSKFIKRDHGGVTMAAFQAAEILLAITRAQLDLFLRQALFPTKAREISADELTHIHARKLAVYIL